PDRFLLFKLCLTPASPLLPYTTLFRSVLQGAGFQVLEAADGVDALALLEKLKGAVDLLVTDVKMPRLSGIEQVYGSLELFQQSRSEEHTSELQSRGQLVCRLLLEKKKF